MSRSVIRSRNGNHFCKGSGVKAVIKQSIDEGKSLIEMREVIVKFKEEGGAQVDAQKTLEALREEYINDEEKEDLLLDLLDFVGGWCRKELRIWE